MANHHRKAVRDALATAVTGLTTTETRVYSGRVAPLTATEKPGLVVVPAEESAQSDGRQSLGPSTMRFGDFDLFAEVEGTTGLFDTLDLIAAEIETAVFADDTLGGVCIAIEPPQTSFRVHDAQGDSDRRQGQMRMRFRVTYRTLQADPTTQV